jgi:hypothetical protein
MHATELRMQYIAHCEASSMQYAAHPTLTPHPDELSRTEFGHKVRASEDGVHHIM